mmetsp:Transcript_71083/g.189005  ORF Transcript_71083/g.189005 Transcript_71083/m.189005 type:complete len:247 (-) Transcript_71083:74-814(-)
MGAEHDEPAHAAGVGVSLKRGIGALGHVLCHLLDVCGCAIVGDDNDPPAHTGDHGLGVAVNEDLCPCVDLGTATFELILLQLGVGVGSLHSLDLLALLGLLLLALLFLDQGRGTEALLDFGVQVVVGAHPRAALDILSQVLLGLLGIGLIEVIFFIGLCLLGLRPRLLGALKLLKSGAPPVPLRGVHLQDRRARQRARDTCAVQTALLQSLGCAWLPNESYDQRKKEHGLVHPWRVAQRMLAVSGL